ncbi:MAG TPA: tetratricopeptide repeat protein [Blastocatellia bacterium]|nr:tetratricopeptide repeat protein [Blastocatellia bacterium]
MIKNRIVIIGALVIALALVGAAVAQSTARVTAQPQDGAKQEKKDGQGSDKRPQALSKYLEAKRLEEAGNYPGAVSAYKEAVELDPQSVELRVGFGSLYLKNRNVIDAEAQAREAMKLAPDNVEVRKLLARVYLAQSFVGSTTVKEKARAAIKELEEVVRLDPNAKIDLGEQEMPALAVIGSLYWTLEEPDKALDAFKRVSEGNSSSDKAHYQLAQLYFQKNKFREAAAAARKAYDVEPKQPEYARLLAKSLLRIGRTQEALEIYKKAMGVKDVATKPDKKTVESKASGEDKSDKNDKDDDGSTEVTINSPLLFDYAEALVFAGRYEEADKLLDPVIKNVRKDHPAYLTAIRLKVDGQRRAGKREEAVRTLEGALKGQDVSDSLPLVYSLGETYEEMLQFDKAISTYEDALASIVNPDGTVNNREQDKQAAGVVLQRIAFAQRLAGRNDQMQATFDRMKKVLGPTEPRADQLIISTLIDEGKNKEAFEMATTAAKRFPDERSFKLYRAQAAGKLGDIATADEIMKALVANKPEDAEVYLFWSSVQLDANQVKQAEESVRKAISLDPNDILPLVSLASVQDRQKKYKESEATLRKVLEIDPDNATVLNNLGYFLADRNERLSEAEALIRRAVNIEPTNGSFLDSLGWLLFKQGRTAEALKYLEQAVVYQQRSATIRDHLGDVYKKQGQIEKARAKWEEALKMSTEPDETKKIKEKLEKK